jgi:hypothetical protein
MAAIQREDNDMPAAAVNVLDRVLDRDGVQARLKRSALAAEATLRAGQPSTCQPAVRKPGVNHAFGKS